MRTVGAAFSFDVDHRTRSERTGFPSAVSTKSVSAGPPISQEVGRPISVSPTQPGSIDIVASSLFASDGLNVMTVVFHVPDPHLVSSAKAGADICDGLTTHFIVGKGDRDRCLGLIFGYDPDR